MKNDEMILRICEDKSIRLEFFENGQKRTKVISVETLTDCISRSLAGVRLTTGLLPATPKRYDGFGQCGAMPFWNSRTNEQR